MSSPFRRRRIVWSLVLLSAAALFYVSTSAPSSFWSLSPSLNGLGLSSSNSPAKQVALAKLGAAQSPAVPELQALLHFVTAYPDRRLNEHAGAIAVAGLGSVEVDPAQAVDLRVYAPGGDRDWKRHLRVLKEQRPLVVFSKTFCPFSQKAKALLHSLDLDPPPQVVELNTRSDGPMIQTILGRLTGRRTVPNVILQGKSLGGSDDIQLLHEEQKLKVLLAGGGVTVDGVLVT